MIPAVTAGDARDGAQSAAGIDTVSMNHCVWLETSENGRGLEDARGSLYLNLHTHRDYSNHFLKILSEDNGAFISNEFALSEVYDRNVNTNFLEMSASYEKSDAHKMKERVVVRLLHRDK